MILNRIIDAIYVANVYTIEQNNVFHICGGHFEYLKLLKGGNVPPTWNCSPRPNRLIIKREKNFMIQFYPDPPRLPVYFVGEGSEGGRMGAVMFVRVIGLSGEDDVREILYDSMGGGGGQHACFSSLYVGGRRTTLLPSTVSWVKWRTAGKLLLEWKAPALVRGSLGASHLWDQHI